MPRQPIRKRKFEGQREAERVATWLNEGFHSAERARITRIIYDIKDFSKETEIMEKKRLLRAGGWFLDHDAVEDFQEFAKELEGRMADYWSATRVELWPSAGSDFNVSFRIAWRPGSDLSEQETNAFLDILALARAGNIHKLKECDSCPRWMFVKFPDGDRCEKHCSNDCREDARRYYMREYQRKRRQDEKQLDERAKIAVGYKVRK